MNDRHLGMAELLVVRDNDRSEPGFELASRHIAECQVCRQEVERLHQVAARLRALPGLEPASDQFPAVRARLDAERRQRWHRRFNTIGIAAAAALALVVVGNDLARPPALDAEQRIDALMARSGELEATLRAWRPEERVVDGRTVEVVLQLEDRIAEVDQRLQRAVQLDPESRRAEQAALWQQRVALMNALVNAHITKSANVTL